MFAKVAEFQVMIGNHRPDVPQLPSEAKAKWGHAALNEEADEFIEACELDADLPVAVDSLIDSIYFAIGLMHSMGLTPEMMEKCFDAVHTANMTKKRGIVDKRPNDGSLPDAVKPEGWVDPAIKIREILNAS